MICGHKWWLFKGALTSKMCNKIIKLGKSKKEEKGFIGKKNIDKLKRNSNVSWLNDKWLYDIVNDFTSTANKNANWNIEINWNEDMQFTTYTKAGHYDWHMDQFDQPYDKSSHKNLIGKIRKLSCIINLSNPKTYEGGDLYVANDNFISHKRDVIRVSDFKNQGSVIVFPSFLFHKVSPLKKGKRYSLVNWSIGYPWK